MSPTRRDLLRSLAGVAVAALPVGAVAAALPATTDDIDRTHVRPYPWDGETRVSSAKRAWHGKLVGTVGSDDLDRHGNCRWLYINACDDGTGVLSITGASSEPGLYPGRDYVHIHLSADVMDGIWKGLFAESEDEPLPTGDAVRAQGKINRDEIAAWRRQQPWYRGAA